MFDIGEGSASHSGRVGFERAEASIANAATADARGRRFERACDYLLRRAREYGLADVWPWRAWPGREAAGFGLQDLGIDLVGRTESGDLWAMQTKFRSDPSKALTWKELATFVAHSARSDLFAYRLVITNTWAVPARFEKSHGGPGDRLAGASGSAGPRRRLAALPRAHSEAS